MTELVPAVEARWRVRKDPAGRGVMGVSLGAFAALSVTAIAFEPEAGGRLFALRDLPARWPATTTTVPRKTSC